MENIMKQRTNKWTAAWALGSACGVAVAAAQTDSQPPTPPGIGPRIAFANTVFDFGRLSSGGVVRHDFIFTNTGAATLEVTAVHASCGCTTAGEWSRKVEPGQTGTIPIQFNSANFSGAVLKKATVQSNDKAQPSVELQIKGNIWKPVDVSPQYAVLQVTSESLSNASSTVRIVSHLDQPLTLDPPESNSPRFSAELKTNQVGKEYELIVRPVPPLVQPNTQGLISLKTSVTNPPTINVVAMALLQPDLVVMPSQIALPAKPLAEPWSAVLTIRNQLSAPLQLSEPRSTVDGVQLELAEVEVGRSFTLKATFPAGFQPAAGAANECIIQSSHARHPVVKIPITKAGS
jgi:hypothetical protein